MTAGRRRRIVFAALIALAGTATAAVAQLPTQAPPAELRSIEIGPLSMTPFLDIREVGWDDNVFNDPDNPQRDFTATIIPRVYGLVQIGWTRLTFASAVDFVYFREFTGERSVNRSAQGRFEVGEGVLRPFVTGSIADTHERLNAEIDARAGRRQHSYGGGLLLVVTDRTSLLVSARRSNLAFDDDARYRAVDLHRTMNSRTDLFEAGLRVALTPLTTWDVTGGLEYERFEREPRRDADTVRITTGLQFHPSALISGRASIGYTQFTPADPELAEYQGLVAQVGLVYALGPTRIEGEVERQVRYSFEEQRPYYLTTHARLTATQQIAGPIDVQGTVGRSVLSYRAFGGGDDESRQDRMIIYGGGVGFRLVDTARFGVNVEWSQRRSDEQPDRHYDRRRVYASLTYGF
ncbi:MAG TPA: outer membrane beta-barrel protein [Vicinamibacterales bacterium]|nr:outer membrane beta-barrel protein [Vicinamibacterales bacterium]